MRYLAILRLYKRFCDSYYVNPTDETLEKIKHLYDEMKKSESSIATLNRNSQRGNYHA